MVSSSNRNQLSPKSRASFHLFQFPRMARIAAVVVLFAATLFSTVLAPAATPTVTTQSKPPAGAGYLKMPLSFEPNRGQTDSSVQFISRGSGYTLFLTPGTAVVNLERQQSASAPGNTPRSSVDSLRMSLAGANPQAQVTALDRQPGVVSYFFGNDPTKWHSAIPTFAKVNYTGIYPGIDLVFYGNQRQLEYDFIVAPGADPSRIAWKIDGATPNIDSEGNLTLAAVHGPAGFEKPVIYQMDGDKKVHVDGAFEVAENQVRFKLGSYDHAKPLIIDPVLEYASYLGGSGIDNIGNTVNQDGNPYQALAVDSKGSAYVVGYTYSINFPLQNPAQGTPPKKGDSRDAWVFVSKFSPDGSSLEYSTYLGGSDNDLGYAIAVDSVGSAYITGLTSSPDFPVTAGAYQTLCGQGWIDTESGYVRAASCPSVESAFVTKLSPSGSTIDYSTFLSGYQGSIGNAIAVDAIGRAYVAGYTDEACNSYQPSWCPFPTTAGALISGSATGGNSPDYVFVSVFNPTGTELLYSTLFGDITPPQTSGRGIGVANTDVTSIAVDSENNFYITGTTSASDFPITKGVFQPTQGPKTANGMQLYATRGYVTKFNALSASNATSLAYSTYLGGHQAGLVDNPTGIAVDKTGNAYISGFTNSYDFPTTAGSFQPTCGSGAPDGCSTAFVTKLNPTASALVWSSYLGNTPALQSNPISAVGPVAIDANDNVYVVGKTAGIFDFVNAAEPGANLGTAQAFVTEFNSLGNKLLFSTYVGASSGNSYSSPAGLAVDAEGNIYVAGNNSGGTLITTPGAFQTEFGGIQDGFVAKIAPHGTAVTTLTATPSPSAVGLPVTLKAVVSASTIGSIPTGKVTFFANSASIGVVQVDTTGTAQLVYTWQFGGQANLQAIYSGDGTYAQSTSKAITLTVGKLTPLTTLKAAPSPVTLGQPIALTAKIAGVTGDPAPTGAVTFYAGSTVLCQTTLNATGTASCATTPANPGTIAFQAKYDGNGYYLPAYSAYIKVNVDEPTATALTVSPNPSWLGEAVKLTATVTPTKGAVVPSGTVTFYTGATSLGSVTLSSTAVATLITSALPVGTNNVTAVYKPLAGYDFIPSTSPAVSEKVVSDIATTTALTISPNPGTADKPVQFSAQVKADSGTAIPSGSITLNVNGKVLQTLALASGKAVFTVSNLASGSYKVFVAYLGSTSAGFAASTATTQTLTIH